MEKKNLNWTSKTLCANMKKGNINFDCSVQRGLVWDSARKSLLIHSMLYGYPIPAFYLVKNPEGGYDALDGKQRSNAIYEFINGDFVLDEVGFPTVYDDDGNDVTADIAGKTYAELPDWAKDRISDYPLSVVYYDDIDEFEVREMFRRLNNGKPLTAVELTRVKAKSIQKFQKIAAHESVQRVVSEKGKARFNDENIAMQIYAMLNMGDNLDFSTKAFRPFIENAEVTDEQMDTIVTALDKVAVLEDALFDEGKENKENARVVRKVKSRSHFVSIVYLATLCADMDDDAFVALVYDFFNTTATTTSNDYNATVGAGSAKAEAVRGRKAAVEKLANSVTKAA